jgi:hypothetical protein
VADIVRLYGLRNWGSSRATSRSKASLDGPTSRSQRPSDPPALGLGLLRVLFCWQALLAEHPAQPAPPSSQAAPSAARGAKATAPNPPSAARGRRRYERGGRG